MKSIGSPRVFVFLAESTGRALALAVLSVSTLFLSSCAQQGNPPKANSTGHVAQANGKARIKVSTGSLCHLVPLPLFAPAGGVSTTKVVPLKASRLGMENLISESRVLTLTATGPFNQYTFTQNHTPPANPASYPVTWNVSVPVAIPAGTPQQYRFSVSTSVRFDDDPSSPVSSVICNDPPSRRGKRQQ